MKLTTWLIPMFFFIIAGCTSTRRDLQLAGEIVLIEHRPDSLAIHTSVYEEDGGLVVVGGLSRGSLDRQRIPGHVDIRILTPDRQELYSLIANFRYMPGPRRQSKNVSFSATFPEVPPKGSILEVSYDTKQH